MGNIFGRPRIETGCKEKHEKKPEKPPPKRPSIVYLDYNATTPLDDSVINSITNALKNAWGNPSSPYSAGKDAKDITQTARKLVAQMIGAKQTDIIFVSGGTEANNWIFQSCVEYYRNASQSSSDELPHVVITNIEHDSVLVTAKKLKEKEIIDLTVVDVSQDTGTVSSFDIVEAIKPSTCLVSVMLANNEVGIIQPVAEISQLVKALNNSRVSAGYNKVLLHTDAAQAIGKIVVDVEELGVDFLTVVGHKFYGPRIGALYVRGPGVATPLYPMFYGGCQEMNFRAGTENTPMIAGLGQAAKLVIENVFDFSKHMAKVRDYMEEKLEETFSDQIHFNGRFSESSRLPNTCNFSFLGEDLEGWKILQKLEKTQASAGAACHADQQSKPSAVLLALGIPESIARNAVRLSVGRETSEDDIDIVVKDLENAVEQLKKDSDS